MESSTGSRRDHAAASWPSYTSKEEGYSNSPKQKCAPLDAKLTLSPLRVSVRTRSQATLASYWSFSVLPRQRCDVHYDLTYCGKDASGYVLPSLAQLPAFEFMP